MNNKTGVPLDTVCQVCKITAAQSMKLPAVLTGINHPQYFETYSFYTDANDKSKKYTCPRCHRDGAIAKILEII